MEFRTWADVLAERGPDTGGAEGVTVMAAPAAPVMPAAPVDRKAGEGPPACCRRACVPADMLVWYGGIAEDALARVRARFPRLAVVPATDLYLCDGCRSTLLRERVLLPEEMPRSR